MPRIESLPAIYYVIQDGELCPIFVCCVCGRPVQEENGRMVADTAGLPKLLPAPRSSDPELDAYPVNFVHHGRCHHALDREVGRNVGWYPLKTMLDPLVLNTRVPHSKWRVIIHLGMSRAKDALPPLWGETS